MKLITKAKLYSKRALTVIGDPLHRWKNQAFLGKQREGVCFDFDCPGRGLFAHFSLFACVAQWASNCQTPFVIRGRSPQYLSRDTGDDWVALLLKQRPFQRSILSLPVLKVSRWEQMPFYRVSLPSTLPEAKSLFRNHFLIADVIAAEVNRLASLLCGDRFVIGLHYRGTDKHVESPRVDPWHAIDCARRALVAVEEKGSKEPVLVVATDEERFLSLITKELSGYRVVSLPGAVRSASDQPIHIHRPERGGRSEARDGFRLAREALLDCLLLGRSKVLLKTSSFLSSWSLLLGDVPSVVSLSRPYEHSNWYPENIIAPIAYEADRVREAVENAIGKSSQSFESPASQ
jgi:hypothetical protein